LLAALHTPPARRLVVSEAARHLASHGVELRVADLHYNLLRLSASVRDVAVSVSGMPPFLRAAGVQVNLDLLELLRGRYVLEDGAASGVRLQYLVGPQGENNLPRFTGAAAEPEPTGVTPEVVIVDLRIVDAHVEYRDVTRNI